MANRWINLTQADRDFILMALAVEKNTPPALIKKIKSHEKISVSSAKAKGRNLQQWVCERISEMTDVPYLPGDDESLIRSREMGQQGTDVVLLGEAVMKFPFAIECKSTESLSLIPTINQARANQVKERDWLVVYKAKALSEPVVIMDWKTLEKLYAGKVGL